MPVATDFGYLGIAKEVTKGTPVAATAFPPIPIARKGVDNVTQLDDVASRGVAMAGPYDQIPGPASSAFTIPDGPLFGDTAPWWVFGLLGDVTSLASRATADGVTTNATTNVTSATAAFTANDVGRPITAGANLPAGTYIVSVTNATTVVVSAAATASGSSLALTVGAASLLSHVGAALNTVPGQCTAYTLTDFYGLTGGTPASQYPGCQVSDVSVKFTGSGLVTIGAMLVGYPTVKVAAPSKSFSTVTPLAGWENLVSIAGAGSLIVSTGELALKRNVAPIDTADGTQAPYGIWQGGLNVTGKLRVIMEGDAELQRYLSNTKPAVTFDFRHGTPGAGFIEAKFQMSKCNYKAAQPDHSGDFAVYDIDLQALWNTTDVGASGGSSPIKATFQNAVAAGTYQ